MALERGHPLTAKFLEKVQYIIVSLRVISWNTVWKLARI